jgi:hypothetical protein
MTAEDRNVTALPVIGNGMAGFVFWVKKVKIVNCSAACCYGVWLTVSLHTGNAAIFTAIAFILFNNDALHLLSP